jgi:hypothetical protein
MNRIHNERNQEMLRTKLVPLSLCAALFGVMTFAAAGAQAAKWLILMSNGEVLTAEQLLANLQAEIDTSTLILHTEIMKVKFLVECTGIQLKGVGLESEGKLTQGGKVKFTDCKGRTNGALNASCTPKSNGEPEGTILTNEGKGQLVLHESENVKIGLIKVEPKNVGAQFVTLEMKEACPVGEKVPIFGVFYVKDCLYKLGACEYKLETHLVTHLWEEGPLTDLYATATKNSEHTVHILGSAWLSLAPEHETLAWSGMPE